MLFEANILFDDSSSSAKLLLLCESLHDKENPVRKTTAAKEIFRTDH